MKANMLSVLITSYNRPNALSACLEAIKAMDFDIPYEVVVTDDGSKEEHISEIKTLKGIDLLLTSEKNKGLGANLNKGIKACKGPYILYCQEDFLLKKELVPALKESFLLLDDGNLDMIRFQANYKFPSLNHVSGHIYKIPHFSFKNFYVNTFQYSDNPFVTKKEFYEEVGYYLEGERGDYGETEFAIRVLSFKRKIGITQPYLVEAHKGSTSTIRKNVTRPKKRVTKKLKRFLRAVRQHLEWMLYSKRKRVLFTYPKKLKE